MTLSGNGRPSGNLFSRIPANGQGALWMLLGGFCFSCMGVGIKFLGAEMDSFQIAFLRALFGFIVILPFALRRGISGLKTKVLRLHIGRGVVGILGMLSIFYAITHLPLADAVALTFTRPLFLILLAVLFLGEKDGKRKRVANFFVAEWRGVAGSRLDAEVGGCRWCLRSAQA